MCPAGAERGCGERGLCRVDPRADFYGDLEIVVADGHSPDGTADLARETGRNRGRRLG